MTDELMCAVCGKAVANADQDEHLRSNHLGPHYFRLNGRPYRTVHPSMRCAEILRALDLPMNAYLWEMRDGKEVDYNHVTAIDLTGRPQLFLEIEPSPKELQTPRSAIQRVAN
jgi:hypothetical protein